MMKVFPRSDTTVLAKQQKINRLKMDLKVRKDLSPRAKEAILRQLDALRGGR